MSFWEIFWFVAVLFSLLSFFYMSVKMLYYGIFELKFMFKTLDDEHLANKEKVNK